MSLGVEVLRIKAGSREIFDMDINVSSLLPITDDVMMGKGQMRWICRNGQGDAVLYSNDMEIYIMMRSGLGMNYLPMPFSRRVSKPYC